MLGEGIVLEEELDELVDKWNHLLDPSSKENLTQDVNNLVSDYLRLLRRRFKKAMPDASRIYKFSDNIAKKQAFRDIKHKEHLKRYIALYALKLLGPKNM